MRWLSGLGAPLVAILLVGLNIKGFYAGKYDSPDYTSGADNYRFILLSHKIRSIDDSNVILSLTIDNKEYVYDLKDNTVLATAIEPAADVAPRRERTRELEILSKLPKTSAFQTALSKALPSGQPSCFLFCGRPLFGGLGYAISYDDPKDYNSTQFQSAVHDTEYWKSLATIALDCARAKTAARRLICESRPLSLYRRNFQEP